jgi:leucyl aminopeptidase
VLVPPAPPAPEPVVSAPPAPDTQDLAASKNAVALAEAKAELKAVQESGERVLRSLASLNLGAVADVSDEEYEALQNRAVGYLSEARKTKDRFTAAVAKAPPGLSGTQETLGKALESLIAAAYNAERFFKSENDTEEKERLANYRRGTQAASAALNKAEGMLAVGNSD